MPELAEVFRFARQWSPGLGRVVTGIRADPTARVFRECDTDALRSGLTGTRLERILTAGKQAAFVFSGNRWLGVRLGMTGRLFTENTRDAQLAWAREDTGENATASPSPKHDLLTIDTGGGPSLVFNDYRRFGKILFHTGSGEPAWWRDRPPEIMSPEFDDKRIGDILAARPRVAIKTLLLDQTGFPGIGNWMADEVLWRAGIDPRTRAGALRKRRRDALLAALKETCADALRVIGEGDGSPPDSWLFNHRWKNGGVCPATGCALVRETLGGRTTCRSPEKQS